MKIVWMVSTWLAIWTIIFLSIGVSCAHDFDLIPTQEQADYIYWLQMEYQNELQQITVDLDYYKRYRANCDKDEAYFIFGKDRYDCWEEVEDYFREKYYEIADLAYKIGGYCEEYFGKRGIQCDIYVNAYKS